MPLRQDDAGEGCSVNLAGWFCEHREFCLLSCPDMQAFGWGNRTSMCALPGIIFSKQQRTASCNHEYKKQQKRMNLVTLLKNRENRDASIVISYFIEQGIGYYLQAQDIPKI